MRRVFFAVPIVCLGLAGCGGDSGGWGDGPESWKPQLQDQKGGGKQGPDGDRGNNTLDQPPFYGDHQDQQQNGDEKKKHLPGSWIAIDGSDNSLVLNEDGQFSERQEIQCIKKPCEPVNVQGKWNTQGKKLTLENEDALDEYEYDINEDGLFLWGKDHPQARCYKKEKHEGNWDHNTSYGDDHQKCDDCLQGKDHSNGDDGSTYDKKPPYGHENHFQGPKGDKDQHPEQEQHPRCNDQYPQNEQEQQPQHDGQENGG